MGLVFCQPCGVVPAHRAGDNGILWPTGTHTQVAKAATPAEAAQQTPVGTRTLSGLHLCAGHTVVG